MSHSACVGNKETYFDFVEGMNYFMPSKQFKAYEWAVAVAFPQLAQTKSLKFNALITSDQEENLTKSIDKLIGNNISNSTEVGCPFGRRRLDMYHISIKEWKNKVGDLC